MFEEKSVPVDACGGCREVSPRGKRKVGATSNTLGTLRIADCKTNA